MTRRRRGFAFQVYVMQVLVITVVAIAFTALTVVAQTERVRQDEEEHIRALSRTVAALPSVVEGLPSGDPTGRIQPVITALREASGVDYITVVGMDGIRVAHTDPDLIGSAVSSDHAAVRRGQEFVGVEQGPSGRTFRVKQPVRAPDGAVVGTLSMGVDASRLADSVLTQARELVTVAAGAVLLGSVLSWLLTLALKRRLHGVEPDEIRTLLRTRASVLDGIGDGLVLVDGDGRIVLANTAARSLVTARVDVGRTAVDVLPRDVAHLVEHALTGDTDLPRSEDVTIGERRVAVTSWPSRLQGRHVGATLLLQDRTELLLALDQVRDQSSRLTLMRRETHEFDNLVHVAAGLIGLGRHEEAARVLTATLDAAEDAAGAERPPEMRIGDPVLAALLHSLGARARAAGIDLVVTEDSSVRGPGAASWTDRPDPTLSTVLGNLVTNALETATSEVRVYVRADDEGFECVVEDDGPGVPADLRERIFEEGVSTKAVGAEERGIGLFLVRSLVTSRGGTVEVGASDLGGASFEVWIPPGHRHRHDAERGSR